MPELPDVEIFKRYADSTSLHQKIKDIDIKDTSLLGNASSRSLKRNLKDEEFISTHRHGKYLFLRTNKNISLILHFGMTGFLKYFKDGDSGPSHIRLLIKFSNNYHLAYDCQRKLGLIDLTKNEQEFIEGKELGPDPYQESFDREIFAKLLGNGRGSIKSTFMNQKHMAGIGNIYADEILFQAGIHPKHNVSKLKDEEIDALYNSMKSVLQTAIDCKVEVNKFPKDYLIRSRNENKTCPICDGSIKKMKISNRTTYFCSKHQRKK